MIESFFLQVRNHLHQKYRELTCGEFASLYYDYVRFHKQYGKTDYNITGFADFLVHAYIDKVIEGSGLTPYGNRNIGGLKPNLSLFKNDSLQTVITVRANRVMSTFTYVQDHRKLKALQEEGENVSSLLISFYKGGPGVTKLREMEDSLVHHRLLLLDLEHNKNLYEQVKPFVLQ